MEIKEQYQEKIKKIVELTGLNEPSISFDPEGRRVSIFVNEGEWIDNWIPRLITELEKVFYLLGKKLGTDGVFVDVNGYRKKRENIIVELAKAAARKTLTTKEQVELPAMNAYERRLVHMELASRPDVKTESIGERGERRVIITLTT